MIFFVVIIIFAGLLVSKRIVGIPISILVLIPLSFVLPPFMVGIYKVGENTNKWMYLLVTGVVGFLVTALVYLMTLVKVIYGSA